MSPTFFKLFKPKIAKNPVPPNSDAKLNQARSRLQGGESDAARAICQEILELQPDHVESLMLLAEVEVREKDLERAMRLYSKVIALRPDHALAHYKRGNAFKDRGQMESALASYEQAVTLNPEYANAFCNRGVVLHALGRSEEALASYQKALAINPLDSLSYYNCGVELRELGRLDEALGNYDKAIEVKPDYAEAYCNRGILLQELNRRDAALASFNQAIQINSGFSQAYFCRGALFGEGKQPVSALADYDRAIELDPDYFEAVCNRGFVYAELGQWGKALENFDRAVALKPNAPEAHCNRAEALMHSNQVEAAIANFDQAFLLKPDFRFLLGTRRHAKMHVCDWQDLGSDIEMLAAGIEADAALSPPMQVLGLLDSAPLHHRAAQIWIREKHPPDGSLGVIPKHPARERIRIGYFSSDFHDHVVPMLAAELFEVHDRSKYEVFAFSCGPDTGDAMRKRLEGAFEHFIDVRQESDRDVAARARSVGIDIAVDLGGHTRNSRTGIFALRAAPIQVNYLGYPGTMGAEYMDYLIGDRVVVPEAHHRYHTEKIAYLPHSFLPHDSGRPISDTLFTREELGLPPTGFVFCCFNNNYKIMPATFDSWMRILGRVPGSVLFLYGKSEKVCDNLRKEARSRGIDSSRLVFGRTLPMPEYLARYRAADLFLDTLPYNAGTTAIDALWAGLPVLTLKGSAFVGRMAASLLQSIELPELITHTAEDYENMAVRLAENPSQLAQIKHKLAQNRLTTALFDTRALTRDLEAAYAAMYDRYQANSSPEHIYVGPQR